MTNSHQLLFNVLTLNKLTLDTNIFSSFLDTIHSEYRDIVQHVIQQIRVLSLSKQPNKYGINSGI